ncbi:DUF6455 family protein [Thalassovita aquimarina]|uniref:DUF6455 domain-containing protein n=1 Tax=Thalassovita aquimarina TaxID=2785917 RepID=A0ABS5HPV0_9RHOB|nr:DUF6455 family protein [Thalassovita aquimarina]MBR9650991.1 hypothetical protein [Thalassovita aquimarina]
MGFINRLSVHTPIMARMGKVLGVDFARAMERDPSAVHKYREAAMRCAQCNREGDCQPWMDAHGQASEAPDYCRNKALLEELSGA